MTRDFTVATFVVWKDRVLMLWHLKLGMWLPPGGHIEANELPDDAAVREVLEETGVRAVLVGECTLPISEPRQLVRPAGIQLENISPGHQHIDLVYFARPENPDQTQLVDGENDHVGWYGIDEMAPMGVSEEVRAWAERALAVVQSVGR